MKKLIIIFYFLISTAVVSTEKNLVDINDVLKNLRCLVCQGQSVADSNSDFSQTIKLVVQDQINEGKTEKQIYKFLKEKYGDWIVYNPSFNMINSILWLFPYLVFLVGGALIFLLLKKRDYR